MQTQIVTCFFNPCRYKRPLENIHRMLRNSDYPIDVVELVYDDRDPEVCNLSGGQTIVVRGDLSKHCCWQKEALLNIGIAAGQLPYVVVLDADVMFSHTDWLERTEDSLSVHKVVQPFTMCKEIPGAVVWPSYAAVHEIRKNPTWHAKAGYALAFRREIAPLVDACIIGGGDLVNICAATGNWDHPIMKSMNRHMKAEVLNQAMRITMQTNGDLGVTLNRLNYMHHGSHDNRQYNSRYRIIRDVVPHVDFFKNGDGIWEWISDGFNDKCLAFFKGRQEDE